MRTTNPLRLYILISGLALTLAGTPPRSHARTISGQSQIKPSSRAQHLCCRSILVLSRMGVLVMRLARPALLSTQTLLPPVSVPQAHPPQVAVPHPETRPPQRLLQAACHHIDTTFYIITHNDPFFAIRNSTHTGRRRTAHPVISFSLSLAKYHRISKLRPNRRRAALLQP